MKTTLPSFGITVEERGMELPKPVWLSMVAAQQAGLISKSNLQTSLDARLRWLISASSFNSLDGKPT